MSFPRGSSLAACPLCTAEACTSQALVTLALKSTMFSTLLLLGGASNSITQICTAPKKGVLDQPECFILKKACKYASLYAPHLGFLSDLGHIQAHSRARRSQHIRLGKQSLGKISCQLTRLGHTPDIDLSNEDCNAECFAIASRSIPWSTLSMVQKAPSPLYPNINCYSGC